MDNGLIVGDANDLERESALMHRLLAMAGDNVAQTTEQLSVDEADNFFTRLVVAAEATLDNWSLSILNARYGLYNRRPMAVDEIAIYSGLPADMVRAHIDSALERLNEQGHREILEGRVDEPCARLVLYVRTAVQPDEEGATAASWPLPTLNCPIWGRCSTCPIYRHCFVERRISSCSGRR